MDREWVVFQNHPRVCVLDKESFPLLNHREQKGLDALPINLGAVVDNEFHRVWAENILKERRVHAKTRKVAVARSFPIKTNVVLGRKWRRLAL
jgi:hypothetical protein